jgi:methionine-rich copper-binding protein CopC
MIMKIAKSLLLAHALCLFSSVLYAHTELKQARPADGAVLNHAPAALELVFSEPVQLLKLSVVDGAGAAVTTGFKPAADSKKTFTIPLPVLVPAAYKASWTIVGKDGHRVEAGLGFTVDPNAPESAGKAPVSEHHDHH